MGVGRKTPALSPGTQVTTNGNSCWPISHHLSLHPYSKALSEVLLRHPCYRWANRASERGGDAPAFTIGFLRMVGL